MASPKIPEIAPVDARKVEMVQKSWKRVNTVTTTVELSGIFYRKLFTAHPDAKELFEDTDMKVQRIALIAMVDSAVSQINNTKLLVPMLFAMGIRHAGYGCVKGHYDAVGDALIGTVEELWVADGNTFDAELRSAWREVYQVIYDAMWAGQETEEGQKLYKRYLQRRAEKRGTKKGWFAFGGVVQTTAIVVVAVTLVLLELKIIGSKK